MQIQAPVSVGELLDKITILQIKLERLNGRARGNVARELALLNQTKSDAHLNNSPEIVTLMSELKAINTALWIIEDQIREFEARGDFGPSFIETARSVYRMNDRRAAIKRQINVISDSEIVEEKSYTNLKEAHAGTLGNSTLLSEKQRPESSSASRVMAGASSF
jgi:hypothetical protein